MRRIIDWTTAWLVRAFFAILGRIPRLPARLLCRRLAELVYYLDRKHRRIGLQNLEFAFPRLSLDRRKAILRESFRQLGELAIEISRLSRSSESSLRSRFHYEPGRGLEHFEAARTEAARQGKGILFVTAHVSVWEILPAAHAVHARPLSFVVRPLDNPYLEAWVNRLRQRFGNQTLSKRQAMRPILKALSQGRDVGFLIDQNVVEREGVYAPFFGRPAATSSAVASLALKTGLPIVCGFVYPEGDAGRYRIRFYPPLTFSADGPEAVDVQQVTAVLNRHIEEVIREFPHCWLWGHKRFRTQPDGRDVYCEQAASD